MSGKPGVKHLLCCIRNKLTYHSLHLLSIIADEFSRYISKIQEMEGSQIVFLVYLKICGCTGLIFISNGITETWLDLFLNQFPTWLSNWFIQNFSKGHTGNLLFILRKRLWFELGLKYISKSYFQINVHYFYQGSRFPFKVSCCKIAENNMDVLF